jgi:hypothetical protein
MLQDFLSGEITDLINKKIEENKEPTRVDISDNVIQKLSGIEALKELPRLLQNIDGIVSEMKEAKSDLYSRFAVVGHDVKDVYLQLDSAFAKTTRERADLKVYMS